MLLFVVEMNSRVHTQVTNAWNAWRRGLNGRTPAAAEVLEHAIQIDRQFSSHMVFIR